jgi:hypothetical protein
VPETGGYTVTRHEELVKFAESAPLPPKIWWHGDEWRIFFESRGSWLVYRAPTWDEASMLLQRAYDYGDVRES